MMNAFDLTVKALRDEGLNSDEILEALSKIFAANYTLEGPVVQKIAFEAMTETQKENKIKDLLQEIGISYNIKGYYYLVKAVLLYESDVTQSLSKGLYPALAEEFGTTKSGIERAIRHAIHSTWKNGDLDVLNGFFGNTIPVHKNSPTNGQFLAMCVEWIKR